MAAGFKDHGLHRGELNHLAGPQQPPSGLCQAGAAVVAAGGPALDDDVRLLAPAAAALVVGLGPALLLRFTLRAIGLAGLGGGRTEELEAPFGGWVRR